MEPTSAPAPVRPAPIMDIAPPSAKPAEQASTPAPAQPPAQAAKPVGSEAPVTATDKSQSAKPTPAPKPAKHKSSVNAPIIAALMVFLALSGLAFYAYTKSHK